MRQWGGEGHTYVEIGSTVKAILIGHHTKRETERGGGGEREEGARRSGGGESKWNGVV